MGDIEPGLAHCGRHKSHASHIQPKPSTCVAQQSTKMMSEQQSDPFAVNPPVAPSYQSPRSSQSAPQLVKHLPVAPSYQPPVQPQPVASSYQPPIQSQPMAPDNDSNLVLTPKHKPDILSPELGAVQDAVVAAVARKLGNDPAEEKQFFATAR